MSRCVSAHGRAICIILAALSAPSLSLAQARPAAKAGDTVEKAAFGRLDDGTTVDQFTLTNSTGSIARIITYGATVTQLWVRDRAGKSGDVVLGFDQFDSYIRNPAWFGSIVGRVANRIAKGRFTLDGKQYSLQINDPPNTLHSGWKDLSRVVWKAEPVTVSHGAAVRFTYLSPDGDQGFPGNLNVSVTYTLTDANELNLVYSARTDKATPVNLTHHSYFNLGGAADILHDIVYLNADYYTPVDSTLIPTGEIAPVKGTPLDFTRPTAVGARIAEMKGNPGGYDHNFVLNGEAGKLKLAARVLDPVSGRQLEMWTTEPGVQFYTGNSLDGSLVGKGGVHYQKHAGLSLEAQHFPDSVNQPRFPSTILRPGAAYHQETIYKFSTR